MNDYKIEIMQGFTYANLCSVLEDTPPQIAPVIEQDTSLSREISLPAEAIHKLAGNTTLEGNSIENIAAEIFSHPDKKSVLEEYAVDERVMSAIAEAITLIALHRAIPSLVSTENATQIRNMAKEICRDSDPVLAKPIQTEIAAVTVLLKQQHPTPELRQ